MIDLAKQVSDEHNLEGQIQVTLERIRDHELQCAKRAGEVNTKLTALDGRMNVLQQRIDLNSKVGWAILASVLGLAFFVLRGSVL